MGHACHRPFRRRCTVTRRNAASHQMHVGSVMYGGSVEVRWNRQSKVAYIVELKQQTISPSYFTATNHGTEQDHYRHHVLSLLTLSICGRVAAFECFE